jgi:hypothetical protein
MNAGIMFGLVVWISWFVHQTGGNQMIDSLIDLPLQQYSLNKFLRSGKPPISFRRRMSQTRRSRMRIWKSCRRKSCRRSLIWRSCLRSSCFLKRSQRSFQRSSCYVRKNSGVHRSCLKNGSVLNWKASRNYRNLKASFAGQVLCRCWAGCFFPQGVYRFCCSDPGTVQREPCSEVWHSTAMLVAGLHQH